MVLDGEMFFTAFLRDITERVEAQEKLDKVNKTIADQLAFTRTLLDTLPSPIFATGPDQRYVTFNRAYEEAYGVRREDRIGKTVMDVETLSLEDRKRWRAENLELLESGGLNETEVNILYADGELHSVLQWVTAYNQADGSPGGILGITADITEQKELERQLERANARMSIELNFAREIQMGMLPLIFPAFPTRHEISVYATLHPAREVGGDFYDFYFLDDEHLCFVIADVAGKGAPGALLMAVSKTLIKSRAADDDEPSSILTHVNNELSRDNPSSMFVTAFLGIVNVKTGEVEYTNAGHNPPYIKRSDGSVEKLDAFHGPVIGAMTGLTYKQDRASLSKNDMIVLYTDGVTEAMDESDRLYSDQRFADLLGSDDLASPESVIDKTVVDVELHQGEAEQADDITILALQYRGRREEIKEIKLEMTIKSRFEDLGIVEEQFYEFAEENDIPDATRQKISIVLDELLNNTVAYAYEDDEEHDIEVDIELSGRRLVLTLKDDGVPFNPFGLGTPDVSSSVDEREIGGLGIHLVRGFMDEYLYQRQINKNVVTLVKVIDQ
jgi:sigma-B regulation protein RsbU (phosphoserine phosphatase)